MSDADRGPHESPSIHGRPHELRTILWVAGRPLATGRGQAVVLEGPAGIGKTHLYDSIRASATDMGFAVASAKCHELDSDRPFGALVDALGLHPDSPNAAKSRIGRFLSTEAADDQADATQVLEVRGPGAQYAIADAVVSHLEELCLVRPLALAIDDAHWADQGTLVAMHRLALRLSSLPILVLITARPLPRTRQLDRLVGELASAGATVVQVEALDKTSVLELVRQVVAAEPGINLMRHVERAAGNPLFVTEIIASLQAEHALDIVDGTAETSVESLPSSLTRTILDRIGHLEAESASLLRMASILGTSFAVADLLKVSGATVAEVVSALEEPLKLGLIVGQGEDFAFKHVLVRESIYADMPTALRRGLHAAAGQALASAPAVSAIQVATHMSLGASAGDAHATTWLRRAAHAALPNAPGVGVEFLERALALAGPSSADMDLLLCELVTALVWAGRSSEAEALARPLLSRSVSAPIRARARLALSQSLLLQNRVQESIDELDMAAEDASGSHGKDRLRILSEASYRRVLAGDLTRGARDAKRVLRESSSTGAHVARIAIAHERFYRGYVSRAVAVARTAFDDAEDGGIDQIARRLDYELAMMLINADRLDEAQGVLESNGLDAGGSGGSWYSPLRHYARGFLRFQAGRWTESLQEFNHGLALADDVETRWESASVLSNLARIHIHRNNLTGADEALAPAESRLDTTCPHYAADLTLWARGLICEAKGDHELALAHFMQASALIEHWGAIVRYRWLAPDLVRVAIATGQRNSASEAVAGLEKVAKRAGVAYLEGAARRCRGLIEGDLKSLLASVAAYRRGNRPIDLAFACEDAGVALGHAGRSSEARLLLHESLVAYEGVEAHRDAARAKAALRKLGVRLGGRGRRRQAAEGWTGLTSAERQVADLVAQGLTTLQIGKALFISSRTVESHLQHIFAKLRISSRVRLAALVGQRNGLP